MLLCCIHKVAFVFLLRSIKKVCMGGGGGMGNNSVQRGEASKAFLKKKKEASFR